MSLRDAAATLRAVSELRKLYLLLPHIPTPAEIELLRRFDILVTDPSLASDEDIAALVAGWKRWWRSGRSDLIGEMAQRLPQGLTERDRDLASYLLAAKLS